MCKFLFVVFVNYFLFLSVSLCLCVCLFLSLSLSLCLCLCLFFYVSLPLSLALYSDIPFPDGDTPKSHSNSFQQIHLPKPPPKSHSNTINISDISLHHTDEMSNLRIDVYHKNKSKTFTILCLGFCVLHKKL